MRGVHLRFNRIHGLRRLAVQQRLSRLAVQPFHYLRLLLLACNIPHAVQSSHVSPQYPAISPLPSLQLRSQARAATPKTHAQENPSCPQGMNPSFKRQSASQCIKPITTLYYITLLPSFIHEATATSPLGILL